VDRVGQYGPAGHDGPQALDPVPDHRGELFFLLLVWLAPHAPYSTILAPPVRYFFGDRVLHYPWHIWFLYHAMKHTHFVASTLAGAFMTGVACLMVQQRYAKTPVSFRDALVSPDIKYVRLLLVWLVS
jgi:hypothetical protein